MSQVNHSTTTYVDINEGIDHARQNEFVGPKKGNFLYNKCYICISIFKWFPVVFILAITIWSYYAYVLQLCLCKCCFFVVFSVNTLFSVHDASKRTEPRHSEATETPTGHSSNRFSFD